MNTTRKQRNTIRDYLRLDRNNRYPLVFEDNDNPPSIQGEGYYWTTLSGKTRVYHPNAYGWPTRYHNSTLHISVGKNWKGLH